MKDFIDLIYYSIKNQPIAAEKTAGNSEEIYLQKQKEILENDFSEVIVKNQEIAFDNFMNYLDDCNNELIRLSFKKGFAVGVAIMKDATKYLQNENEYSLQKLLEKLQ